VYAGLNVCSADLTPRLCQHCMLAKTERGALLTFLPLYFFVTCPTKIRNVLKNYF
jgi:hypothetical protein